MAPSVVTALSRFASRFSTPTAVLGALFIPTPDNGGVTSGTLPGAPDISFEKDDPAGRLRLSTTSAEGASVRIETQLRGGIYVDVVTGIPIGRDLDGQLYFDFDAVRQVIADAEPQSARGGPDEKPKAAADEPKLCPAPTPDTPHYASQRANAYEEQMHERVNPVAPIPNGFAIKLTDPATGEPVFVDDCFRYAGDLVDGDMKAGDLAEAKGPTKEFLYGRSWSLDDDVKQAAKELRVANERGVGLKWYFAEPRAAAIARQAFIDHGLAKIVVGVMPPR